MIDIRFSVLLMEELKYMPNSLNFTPNFSSLFSSFNNKLRIYQPNRRQKILPRNK